MNDNYDFASPNTGGWTAAAAGSVLQSVLQDAGVGVWALDVATETLIASEQCKLMFGHRPESPFSYDDMLYALDGQHRRTWREALDKAIETGEELVVEVKLQTPLHQVRWIELRGKASGALIKTAPIITGVLLDITARREADEHRKLLSNEARHRAKNFFALAQAVVAQSIRTAVSLQDAQARSMGRLQALASAQDLIPDLGWGCADLADVVEKSVLPFQADNIHTAGPHVLLGPKVVSTLSLALHELATNSTKYGALSASGGSVEVFWTIEQQETLMLRFRWIEAGGPEVVFPVRSGFGSRILGELVQLELRATTRIDFRPSGVIYEIVAPVASLCMEPGSGQLPRTGG